MQHKFIKFRVKRQDYMVSKFSCDVLLNSLGVNIALHSMVHKVAAYGYHVFVCTPEEFADFLIERNLAGMTNSFMDLRAERIYTLSGLDKSIIIRSHEVTNAIN